MPKITNKRKKRGESNSLHDDIHLTDEDTPMEEENSDSNSDDFEQKEKVEAKSNKRKHEDIESSDEETNGPVLKKLKANAKPSSNQPLQAIPTHTLPQIIDLKEDEIPEPLVDLKILSHVLNDLDLGGSPLQGENFYRTAAHLYHCLLKMTDGRIKINGLSQHDTTILIQRAHSLCSLLKPFIQADLKLQNLKIVMDEMGTSNGAKISYVKVPAQQNKLQELAKCLLKHLRVNGRVLIPGGWIGTPGHAMVYDLSTSVLLVRNSGAGISYHLGEETPIGTQFQPVVAFKIPNLPALADDLLTEFIIKLITPCNIENANKSNAEIIYKTILPHVKFLNGVEVDPTPYAATTTFGQISGTCAWAVLKSLAENDTFKEFNFDDIYLEILKETLFLAFKNLKQHSIEKGWIHQCALSIKNFSLFLRDSSKLNTYRLKEGWDRVVDYSNMLRSITPSKDTIQEIGKTLKTIDPNTSGYMVIGEDFQLNKLRPNSHRLSNESKYREMSQLQSSFSTKTPNALMDWLEGEISNDLKRSFQTSKSIYCTNDLRYLEEILISLPLKKEYWQPSIENIVPKWCEILEKTLILYCRLCDANSTTVFTSQKIAAMSVIALYVQFINILYENNAELKADFLKLINESHDSFVGTIRNLEFMITDPIYALRDKEICEIIRNYKSTDGGLHPMFKIANLSQELKSEARGVTLGPEQYSVPETMQAAVYYHKNRLWDKYDVTTFPHGMRHKYIEIEKHYQFYFSCLKLAKLAENMLAPKIRHMETYDFFETPYQKWSEYVTYEVVDQKIKCRTFCDAFSVISSSKANHFALSNEELKGDFRRHFITDNKIQLTIHSNLVSEEIDLRRNLFHLRVNGGTQIISTIEFIKANYKLAQKNDVYKTVFAILFYSSLLNEALELNASAIKELIFVLDGLVDLYITREYFHELIYLYDMSCFLQKFCVQYYLQHQRKFNNELDSVKPIDRLDGINTKIVKCFNHVYASNLRTSSDYATQCHFYATRVVELANLLRLNGFLEQIVWAEFFVINHKLRLINTNNLDPVILMECLLSADQLKFAATLPATKLDLDFILAYVNKRLELRLTIPSNGNQYTSLMITQGHCTLDLLNGNIYWNNSQQVALPREVYKNDLVSSLFGHAVLSAKKFENKNLDTVYEVNVHNKAYRFKCDSFNQVKRIGLVHTVLGVTQWYQSLSEIEVRLLAARRSSNLSIPFRLCDKKKLVWQGENGSLLFTNATLDKVVAFFEITRPPYEGSLYLLNSRDEKEWIYVRSDKEFNFLRCFEGKQFIEIWQNVNTKQFKISLPRYDLTFLSKEIQGRIQFIWQQNPEYELVMGKNSILRNFDHVLTLRKIRETSKKSYLYLVPKQELIPTEKEDGDNYLLELDINNKLNCCHYLIETIGSVKKNKIETGEVETSDLDECLAKPNLFEFDSSEQYVALTVDELGELKTTNPMDCGYLAYLYFNLGSPEKAFKLLRQCLSYPNITADLIKYLILILCESPCSLPDSKHATKASFTSPNHVAVKLMAYFLYCQSLNNGESRSSMKIGIKHQNYFNSSLTLLCTGIKSGQFEDSIPLLISTLLGYFKLKAFIPKDLHLTKEQLLTLLNIVKRNSEELPFTLAYQRLTIKLKLSLKLYVNQMLAWEKNTIREGLRAKIAKTVEKLSQVTILVPYKQKISFEVNRLTANTQANSCNVNDDYFEAYEKMKGGISPDLTISQLTLNTEEYKIYSAMFSLYLQAVADKSNMDSLQEFLNKKIAVMAETTDEWRRTNPSILFHIILLKVMLCNVDKTNYILAHAVKRGGKQKEDGYIASTLSHFKDWYHMGARASTCLQYTSRLAVAFDAEVLSFMQALHPGVKNEENKAIFQFSNLIPKQLPKTPQYSAPYEAIFPEVSTVLAHLNVSLNLPSMQQLKEQAEGVTPNIFSYKVTNPVPFIQELFDEANLDYVKGRQRNAAHSMSNDEYIQKLSDPETLKRLKLTAQTILTTGKPKLNELIDKIEGILNFGPSGLKMHEKLKWQLGFEANINKRLTIKEAIAYFSKTSISEIKRKRKIDDIEDSQLFSLIIQYLEEATACQHWERISRALDELNGLSEEPHAALHLIHKLGHLLTLKRCYSPLEFPSILVFEYLDNKLIYPIQFKIIQKFLERKADGHFVSKVIQLIMGGGKSKVILPLLAELMADGTNCVIIEVPEELLETNFNDLAALSLKVFNKRVHIFKFHRDYECSTQQLRGILDELKMVMVNKEYLLTTRKNIDSFVLKYVETLIAPDNDIDEWLSRIDYLDKIINILCEETDAIIDEEDLTLKNNDHLIYTIQEGRPFAKNILKSLVHLFDFTKVVTIIDSVTKINLNDVVLGRISRPKPALLIKLITRLAEELVQNEGSPLYSMCRTANPQTRGTFKAFLLNLLPTIPECVANLRSFERDLISIYKEELSNILKLSLSKDYKVNYGLSQDKNKKGVDLETALPYIGNNKPNESSKFQNQLLTLNFTIQSQLRKPLSLYLIKQFLEHFKKRHEVEKSLNSYKTNKTTNVIKEFREITGLNDVDFDTLDLRNESQINSIYQRLNNNENVKRFCLVEFVLPAILSNAQTLTSNAINHVIYRSTNGFTGTDYNFRTLHQNIVRDNSESFGTDGQTIDHLLKNLNQDCHVLKTNGIEEFFQYLFTHPEINKMHAVIDCAPLFKGIPNREVANVFSAQFAELNKRQTDIQYILFFNDEDALCALPVSNEPEKMIEIVLKHTEEIGKRLGCEPHQYFTYYADRQKTGIDILNADHTRALITVGEDNTLRDILQGSMRLRDLKGTHRCEFVILNSFYLANEWLRTYGTKVTVLLNALFLHQCEVLLEWHFEGAIQKIHNAFRTDLFNRVRAASLKKEKVQLAVSFASFFFDTESDDYYARYALPTVLMPTEGILQDFYNETLKRWQRCILEAGIKQVPELEQTIMPLCRKIIAEAIKICTPTHQSPALVQRDNQVIAQREAQNQMLKENERQQQVEPSLLMAREYLSWQKVDLNTFDPKTHKTEPGPFITLEQMVNTHTKAREWHFSDNLLVSQNYLEVTHNFLSDKLNNLTKPSYFILGVVENHSLYQMLITQREAEQIKTLRAPANKQIWIETPGNIPYLNEVPPEVKGSSEYLAIMEQIQYFNGDCAYLATNFDNLVWLKDKTLTKFSYLENELLRLHPMKSAHFTLLKSLAKEHGWLPENQEEGATAQNVKLELNKKAAWIVQKHEWKKAGKKIAEKTFETAVTGIVATKDFITKTSENDIKYGTLEGIESIESLRELQALQAGLGYGVVGLVNPYSYSAPIVYSVGSKARFYGGQSVQIDAIERQKEKINKNTKKRVLKEV